MKENLKLPTGEELLLRQGTEADMNDLKKLYFDVYGGRYTLPEVTNRDKMKWVLNDPNYFWLLACCYDRLIGSVIFVVDKKDRVGKSLAGVVIPQFEGKHVMLSLMTSGLNYVMEKQNWCDLQYAVVRTVSLAPQKMLSKLGFVGLGIFPNVRKIKGYETHGLAALFKPNTLAARQQTPILIPPVEQIFKITSSVLKLGRAKVKGQEQFSSRIKMQLKKIQELPNIVKGTYKQKKQAVKPGNIPVIKTSNQEIELIIEKSKEVEWEYYLLRDKGVLLAEFFPFHYPNVKLHTIDQSTEVFLNFQEIDGHADLLGIKTDRNDIAYLLNRVGDYAESLGIKYLEMLVSAYDPDLQQAAYIANFLPCAYVPAFRMGENGERLDYVVMFRSFVPLTFGGLKLTDKTKPYLAAFYKIYTKRLMEEIEENG